MNTNQPAAKDLGRHSVDQGPSGAAEGLETVAEALREGVEGLLGEERVKDFARAATDRLSSSADFIRSRDPHRIMADIRRVVTSNPGVALVVAAACGFAVGRALLRR